MRLILVLCLFVCSHVVAQNAILAEDYLKNGDFEKALYAYKKLYKESPSSTKYINKLINVHQELEQYNEVETLLLKALERRKYPSFYVELGYNYQLQNNESKAKTYYNKAIASVDDNVNNAYSVARSFQNHSLLNETITVYEKAMLLNPKLNFKLQLAKIYGEQGNVEKMLNSYLDYAQRDKGSISYIKRAVNDFISENSSNPNNITFRNILIKKLQESPNVIWNDLLSWMFIQQKDFKKAFVQEKAIYKRRLGSLFRIQVLASIVEKENEPEIAQSILEYVLENAQDDATKIETHHNLLALQTKLATKEDYNNIDQKYTAVFNTFGRQSNTFKLQIAYAHFLAFYKNETKQATQLLKKTLKLPLGKAQQAQIKLELGDILVLQEKFNQALIYYTQIQRNLKNSTISQEARFKVAKASYYKGDFKWAESQLKILKASTSQLIANDALDLKLLISDNKYEDSLQTALKLYAKADLLTFQNKKTEAITVLNSILKNHNTEPIVAQALLKQAQLYTSTLQFDKAKANYEVIIENYNDGILTDDAYYALANIYEKQFKQPEQAKALYEKIIFNHADSIYFVEARKKYRALRGDSIN